LAAAARCSAALPGVLPGKVFVIGGGASGVNAARMAQGLGADVTILEVDLERMRFSTSRCIRAHNFYSNEAHLMELMPNIDLLIGRGAGSGAKAPKLISANAPSYAPRQRAVDIAIDQGGCAETSRATTHHDPVYVEEGVTHYCVAICRCLRAHRHAGAHERDASLRRTARRPRSRRCVQKQPALIGGIK